MEEIRELMQRYDEAKAAWVAHFGSFDEAAFHAWFTAHVLRA